MYFSTEQKEDFQNKLMAQKLKEEHPEADVSKIEIAESLRAASLTPTY